MTKILGAAGIDISDWRSCWRRFDFWLAVATLLMPFGFVLLALQPARVRARARRRG